MNTRSNCLALIAAAALAAPVLADNAAAPVGEPVLEAPTLRSLGMHWIVRGDENANATVTLQYRKSGGEWKKGMPLFRVEKNAHDPAKADYKDKSGATKTLLNVPDDAWLFAGSALLLDADTDYELKLTLNDPDGGAGEHVFKARTAAEPVAPANAPIRHVIPGSGGGSGTKADPFKGVAAAQKAAKPGDILLLGEGTYDKPVTVTRSGEPGKPIIWRGVDREKVIFKGGEKSAKDLGHKDKADDFAERIIDAAGAHDVWFENLTISHGRHAIVAHEATRIVVRGCHIHDVFFGVTATKNPDDKMSGFFITDNVMEGASKWPRTKDMGIEDSRGIQITGSGSVVAYNKLTAFGDAVDTFGSVRTEDIDIHNNDIELMTDDGIESDYSQRNVRVFENRLTNVFQGISCQPVYGGPVYIFRNTMYGVTIEPFKLHNGPSGALLMHNTVVKEGHAWELWTGKAVHNIISRNNLFLGNNASYAFVAESGDTKGCDFDYDGLGGTGFKQFLKWNKQKYATIDDVKANAPIYKHATLIDATTAFASGITPPDSDQVRLPIGDLRLSEKSAAVDAGTPIAGLNDGYQGSAPDLGALEAGAPLPHYGPREGK